MPRISVERLSQGKQQRLAALSLALAVVSFPINLVAAPSCVSKMVVGYYPDWAQGSYTPAMIPYENLSHIFHFAGLPNNDGTLQNNTPAANPALITTAHANGVKVTVCIGGWGWDTQFANGTSTAAGRTNMTNAIVNLITTRGYDGVDMDWEYPNLASEQNNFKLLSQQIRTALDGIDPALEMSFCAVGNYVGYYDLPFLQGIYDFMFAMTYDQHGSWSGHPGHNSATFGTPSCCGHSFSAADDVDDWVTLGGWPADRILMGVPFYGYDYSSGTACGVGSPASSQLTNRQIWALGYPESWDNDAKVPYTVGGGHWYSHSNDESVSIKAQHVLDNGYGGLLIWHIGQDRYLGAQPCLEAIGEVFCPRGVTIGKSVDKLLSFPGTDVTFTLAYSNTSGSTVNNVYVRDTLPGGLTYISSDPVGAFQAPGIYEWSLGNLSAGQAGTITLVAQLNGGAGAEINEAITWGDSGEPETSTAITGTELRVNCAGNEYVDGGGDTWQADRAFVAGSWGYLDGAASAPDISPVGGTTDDELFYAERYGCPTEWEYRFTVPNGEYQVRMLFSEGWCSAAACRVFDVTIEGSTVISNLDIYALVGDFFAYEETHQVTVADGELNIASITTADCGEVRAIEITALSLPYTPTPTGTSTNTSTLTLTATPSPTSTVTGTYTLSATHTLTATQSASQTPTATPTATPTMTETATESPTATISPTGPPAPSGTPTVSPTPTPTPGPPKVIDAVFFPNPVTDAENVYFTYKLSGKADKVVLKVFTISGRRLLEVEMEPQGWGSYVRLSLPFDGGDGLDGLANGVYFFLFEAHQNTVVVDMKTGKLVILR